MMLNGIKYITNAETAKRLGIKTETLNHIRLYGRYKKNPIMDKGPVGWIKKQSDGSIYYPEDEVNKYIKSQFLHSKNQTQNTYLEALNSVKSLTKDKKSNRNHLYSILDNNKNNIKTPGFRDKIIVK